MKKIIGGMSYDTETADLLASAEHGHEMSQAWWHLYRTSQGAFFEVAAGHDGDLALLWHFRLGDVCKEHVTVRTLPGWRSCEEVEDRLPDGRHAWLWWGS
jgi:hypothetical protein